MITTKKSLSGATGRGKGKRCRSGCATCRGAGYKCDEAKPFCGRCVRLRKPCPGYELRLRWRHHDYTKSKINSQPRQSCAFRGAEVEVEDCEATSIISPPRVDQLAMSSPEQDVTTPELSTPGASSTAGTYTSNDSVTSPSLSLKAGQLPEEDMCAIVLSQSELTYWTPYLRFEDYRLLHHFTTVLSSFISVDSIGNPFQMHFTSMAFQEGPLQSAMLSVAASHLAKVLPHENAEFIASRHHQAAIRSLASAVEDPIESVSDSTLAAILMLQVRRQFVDDIDEKIDCHLAAAREIILLRGGPSALSTPCAQFLLSLFGYHDIMCSISHARAPLSVDTDRISSFTTAPLLGGASEILHIASEISLLQAWKKSKAKVSEEQIQVLAQNIEFKLETWEIPPHAFQDPDLMNTAIAYRGAASIYLFRVAYNIGAPHPRTLHRVRLCLDALSQVPLTSPWSSMHAWPLFTSGCEAVDPADRLFVRQRFDEMYQCRGMPSLVRVREAMERVWECKDLEGQDNRPDLMIKLGCIEALNSLGVEVDLV